MYIYLYIFEGYQKVSILLVDVEIVRHKITFQKLHVSLFGYSVNNNGGGWYRRTFYEYSAFLATLKIKLIDFVLKQKSFIAACPKLLNASLHLFSPYTFFSPQMEFSFNFINLKLKLLRHVYLIECDLICWWFESEWAVQR
jgi:hypothetical protein